LDLIRKVALLEKESDKQPKEEEKKTAGEKKKKVRKINTIDKEFMEFITGQVESNSSQNSSPEKN